MSDFGVAVVADITRNAVTLEGGSNLSVALNIGPALGSTTTPTTPTTSGITAAVALGGHRALVASGEYADQTNAAHFNRVVGVTTAAVSAGSPVVMQASGSLTFSGWSWTPGNDIYVGSNGLLTQTIPTAGAFLQAIGFALTSTSMWIEIHPPILL